MFPVAIETEGVSAPSLVQYNYGLPVLLQNLIHSLQGFGTLVLSSAEHVFHTE